MNRSPLWTVDDAVGVFASQGQPVDPDQLRWMIRAMRIQPSARAASSDKGGRGKALYPAGLFQRMHALLADAVSGDT